MSDYQRYGWLMALFMQILGMEIFILFYTWLNLVVILYYIILYEPLPNNI